MIITLQTKRLDFRKCSCSEGFSPGTQICLRGGSHINRTGVLVISLKGLKHDLDTSWGFQAYKVNSDTFSSIEPKNMAVRK